MQTITEFPVIQITREELKKAGDFSTLRKVLEARGLCFNLSNAPTGWELCFKGWFTTDGYCVQNFYREERKDDQDGR